MKQSFQTDDGRTLAYERRGRGPLLVCHPGGPGFSAHYFDGDLGGLDRAFTLILFDPRGTGGSSKPADARAYATEDYVADVERLRAQLGEEQLNILGHSHGGVVAAAYAATHPDRVCRVVIASSLARFHPDVMEVEMQTHAHEPWYDGAREALDRESGGDYDTPEELAEIVGAFMPMYFAHWDDAASAYVRRALTERANPDALKLFNEDLDTWDIRPDVARITAPVLVITGERDFICGPACAADFADAAAQTTVIVEDAGHFLFVETPQRWREEVTAFLL